MIIQNAGALPSDAKSQRAIGILEAGLEAAMPSRFLAGYTGQDRIILGDTVIETAGYSAVHCVAFGKAADSMCAAFCKNVRVASGHVVIPRGQRSRLRGKKFTVYHAAHPVPDRTSMAAARALQKFLKRRRESELVVFLVSGGASSLLCMPDSVEFSDKAHATDILLRSGATISETNCIRKHLSGIKGGRLVENLRCDAVSLLASDVEGDDPSAIASGTTYCDDTTWGDARDIIARYDLANAMPEAVMARIEDGASGRIPETPKRPVVPNHVVASNADCISAMKRRAEEYGYRTETLSVFGNMDRAVRRILDTLKENPDSCIIFGGETTVRVSGTGRGGRNQEIVLRLLAELGGHGRRSIISSIGTDGIDGNTEYAGAFCRATLADAPGISDHIRNNDSAAFFERHGGVIRTGHTRTNLMDIGIVLPQAARSAQR